MGFRDRFSAWLVEHGAEAESIPSLLDAYCGFLNGEAFAPLRTANEDLRRPGLKVV